MPPECSASSPELPSFFGMDVIVAGPGCDDGEVQLDVVLMQRAAAGSEAAFAEIVNRHQQKLVNYFVRMGASADREDLAQETFVRLFAYRKRYRPSARFTTFLYHLARNVWADRGRKLKRQERLAQAYQHKCPEDASPDPAGRGENLDVATALDRLSPKLREVIVLNIYQGLRYQEVADVLQIPLGTVKSRLNLALAALREMFHEA